jgi:hypothetical protein
VPYRPENRHGGNADHPSQTPPDPKAPYARSTTPTSRYVCIPNGGHSTPGSWTSPSHVHVYPPATYPANTKPTAPMVSPTIATSRGY